MVFCFTITAPTGKTAAFVPKASAAALRLRLGIRWYSEKWLVFSTAHHHLDGLCPSGTLVSKKLKPKITSH
jgi:hypothetical protein